MEKACISEEDDNNSKAKSIQRSVSGRVRSNSILIDIFSKLDVKTLVRLRLVSKSWHDLISSPQFVKSHFDLTAVKAEENKSTLNYFHRFSGFAYVSILDPQASHVKTFCLKNIPYHNVPNRTFKLLGSCNGLILINWGSLFLLWNHSTGEYKKLANYAYRPQEPFTSSTSADSYIYGLGYDSILNDYKAVIFRKSKVVDFVSSRQTYMYLCTGCITTGHWRRLSVSRQNFPYFIGANRTHNCVGLTINGSPHWAVSDFSSRKCIIYFDMAEDKVKMLATPSFSSSRIEEGSLELSILGGCLCATFQNLADKCFDVWAMKEYGVKESWTKLFVIPKSEAALQVRPIGFINNGVEIVLEIRRKIGEYSKSKFRVDSLVSYNIKTKRELFLLPTQSKTSAISFQSLISPQATSK